MLVYMVNNKPSDLSPDVCREFEQQILAAWADEEIPDASNLAESGCPEDEDMVRRFADKHFDEIAPGCPSRCEDAPFVYMTLAASKYYLASYLLYHVRETGPFMDTPSIHLVSTLTHRKERKRIAKVLSPAQAACVARFVGLVHENLKLFYAEDDVDQIVAALEFWQQQSASNRE